MNTVKAQVALTRSLWMCGGVMTHEEPRSQAPLCDEVLFVAAHSGGSLGMRLLYEKVAVKCMRLNINEG